MLYHTNLGGSPTLRMLFDSAKDWLQGKDEQCLDHQALDHQSTKWSLLGESRPK